MIDEPTTEERLAALLARRSPRPERGPKAAAPTRGTRRGRDVGPPATGRTIRTAAPPATPFERSFDRWPGSWADAPRPPAPAGPTGGVFDFDTPGWPAQDAAPPMDPEPPLPGPTRTGPARRLLSDATMPLAAVPTEEPADEGLGDRFRDGAERWLRSWSPTRLVASGASAVSFAAMIVAMGPLLAPDEEAATDAGTGGDVDADSALAVEAPAVSITVDPAATGVPGTPLDATGQPIPLSGTTPDAALAAGGSASTIAGAPAAGAPAAGATASTTANSAATASTTKPATSAPGSSAGQGTTAPPATAAPTTAPPATAAPTTAKPGSTAPPATAAPTTQAPTTAPPTTAKPTTTAPPTTAKPTTTAPPTTKAS